MNKLNIVRGDLKNKPVSSKKLTDYFETVKDKYEGTLYIGYPIISTAGGGYQIDALLITRQKGIIIFNIEEGVNFNNNYIDIQDENYTKLYSKFIQYKELTKGRNLVIEIRTVTYSPACNRDINFDKDNNYPYLFSNEELDNYIQNLESNDNEYFEQVVSVLQSITTIRRNKSRNYVKKEDSRGAKLKKLEDSIANLDRQQSSAVIETVDGVQRIRGLAGSGKTIILALKIAYLHAKNPSWKIAVTFNTRSLKDQLRKFIIQFCYENTNEEPNWENIDIIHAWGNSSSEGIYFNLCKDHNIEFLDFKKAKKNNNTYGKEFDFVCEDALRNISNFKQKYDLVVVDEAQDFSKEFLRICYNIVKHPKRLVYAYDELQSLNKKAMESPEEIFGFDSLGNPLVSLNNKQGKPKEDIILYKCYRNSLEILTTAHALGFGIYKNNMVQMFENSDLWKDIGYEVIKGNLQDGQNVVLKRNNETSPDFLSTHSDKEDLLIFKCFETNNEQVDYIVSEIKKNIEIDELNPNDIMVINPNPLTTKNVVGIFRQRLFDNGINSSLAGVSSSPDIFYEGDKITFTGVHRAKGNEASMVYIINSEYCYDGLDLSKKRNILFTAMTRSKAWVRVCGCGEGMKGLQNELEQVKENNYSLSFKYPTKDERKKMNIVNRDKSSDEKDRIKKNEDNLKQILEDITESRMHKEDIPQELINKLKRIML